MIPGYTIIQKLYDTDRVQVYRAQRCSDQRPVVLKLLCGKHPSFQELVQFRNQYTIARQFNAPELLQVYAIEPYENGYALVMEDYQGIALAQYLKQHAPTGIALPEFLKIAVQIVKAIALIHQQQVVHKDIKPANLLIHPDTQQIKLIDFSIASQLPRENQPPIHLNQLEGTLAYIAPEQTGRMNRGIDCRCDFYALGITFYELLTGELPFTTQDPSELLYCHLAKLPVSVVQLRSEIPQVISQIIDKLITKNAENRYQTASGLLHDLQTAQHQLETFGVIAPFAIATQDTPDRFTIAEKLYGRELDVQQLLSTFEQVAQGKTALTLVAGFSGIGKTAVVNEVHKPIVRQRGYFIKGKYDQFQRNVPLSALIQAFRELVRQLLAESPQQIAQWRDRILQGIGQQAGLLLEFIPELQHIIGEQPCLDEQTVSGTQNQLSRVIQQFVSLFATIEHPLVLFLDDLQWADSASLKLLQELLNAQNEQALFVIGAYRDNEVSMAHPLMLMLDEIQKTSPETITLDSLKFTSINQLIADTFNTSIEQTRSLSELIHQKTQGNPFFIIQTLRSLYDDGYICFDQSQHCWQCDVSQLHKLGLTDDVLTLMSAQLKKLPEPTQNVLQRAACMGNQFDLATLAIVCDLPTQATAQRLWAALQAGLILPMNEVYKFFQTETQAEEVTPPPATYQFLHDRIQQAAYQLIPAEQTAKIHLCIGRQLFQNLLPEQRNNQVFTIVQQFNHGISLLESEVERSQVLDLNWLAGRKAQAATAYPAAQHYLETAIALLPKTAWDTEYERTFSLYRQGLEATYLNSDTDQMHHWANVAFAQVTQPLDQVYLDEVIIYSHIAQGDPASAIDLGLKNLARLGIDLPAHPSQDYLQAIYAQIWTALEKTNCDRSTTISALIDLPRMENDRILAAMRILHALAPALVLAARSELFLLNTMTEVQLSLEYGNTAISAAAYAHFSAALCGLFNEIDLAQQFGELALQVAQLIPDPSIQSRVFLIVGGITTVWTKPLRSGIPLLQKGYEQGLESGTLEMAAFNCWYESQASYFMGEHLHDLAKTLFIHDEQIARLHQPMLLKHNQWLAHIVDVLINSSDRPLQDIQNSAQSFLQDYQAANNTLGLFYVHLHQLILQVIFGQATAAQAVEARRYLKSAIGQASVPYLYWFDSLALLASDPDWQRIEENQQKLQHWATFAPSNFQHKYDLVAAECDRIRGNYAAAIELYDCAIQGAQVQGYFQEAALASELAAKFYLAWGKEKVAASYLQDAYYDYARWGAKAKLDALEQDYPHLLKAILAESTLQHPGIIETITFLGNPINLSSTSKTRDRTRVNTTLDLVSVLKASQTLTSTIQMDELLSKLILIMLEHSGAEHCALILKQDQAWQLRVWADATTTCLQNLPLAECSTLPIKLIRYVQNTQETVFTDDLTGKTPVLDEYFIEHQPQSFLCLPILNQSKLIGILYLENRSTRGIFYHDRLLILNFFASQAAIALDNARLYHQVQTTLNELQQTQLQLVQNEKMSALGNLVAGVAHEINNPVGCVVGNVKVIQDYMSGLLGLIDLYHQKVPNPDPEVEEERDAIDLDYVREDLPKLIRAVENGGDRILAISQSLRTFSRADTDQKQAFDLHKGIESTLLILRHRLKANAQRPEIEVITEYADLPLVDCFPGQLNQVFMNLLANAIDALEESNQGQHFHNIQNRIHIRTWLDEDQVKIAIADNGPGMSDSVKQRIFDHLFTTKVAGKGTGLGLAIVHQIIVEKHDGAIAVESELGQGTEFILTLPLD